MRIPISLILCLLILVAVPAFSQYPWCADEDQITARADEGSLILRHDLATYNCCSDAFTFEAEIDGFTLQVTEYEILGAPCDCLCCYNLGTTIAGLEPGLWTVLYRWLDNDTWTWRQEQLTVLIEGSAKAEPVLGGTLENSGCLEAGGVTDAPAAETALAQNQPNPFNPNTTIRFRVPRPVAVDLTVFDATGRLVRTLLQGETARPGWNEAVWDGRDDAGRQLASGAYFYRLQAGPFSETRSMVLLR